MRTATASTPGSSPFVGSEIDFLADYIMSSWLNFQLGYGHFFVGDYIRQSVGSLPTNAGAVDADLVYVQANFKF